MYVCVCLREYVCPTEFLGCRFPSFSLSLSNSFGDCPSPSADDFPWSFAYAVPKNEPCRDSRVGEFSTKTRCRCDDDDVGNCEPYVDSTAVNEPN